MDISNSSLFHSCKWLTGMFRCFNIIWPTSGGGLSTSQSCYVTLSCPGTTSIFYLPIFIIIHVMCGCHTARASGGGTGGDCVLKMRERPRGKRMKCLVCDATMTCKPGVGEGMATGLCAYRTGGTMTCPLQQLSQHFVLHGRMRNISIPLLQLLQDLHTGDVVTQLRNCMHGSAQV